MGAAAVHTLVADLWLRFFRVKLAASTLPMCKHLSPRAWVCACSRLG